MSRARADVYVCICTSSARASPRVTRAFITGVGYAARGTRLRSGARWCALFLEASRSSECKCKCGDFLWAGEWFARWFVNRIVAVLCMFVLGFDV